MKRSREFGTMNRGGRYPVRLLFSALFLLCLSGGLSAQQGGDFSPYWFAGAEVGPRVYYGDHNRQMDNGDRISFGGGLFAGRQWSPVLGARLGLSFQSIRGLTQNGSYSTGYYYDPSQRLYEQQYNVTYLHADFMYNAVNHIFGYRSDRVYNLTLYAGPAWGYVLDSPRKGTLSLSGGFLNSFRVSDAVSLNLDIHDALVSDKFDNEPGGRCGEGFLSISAGFTYRFGRR